jgi:hypothetical protein
MVFQRRHVSGSNRLFRSKSPSDRHPYSPILVHSPLTIAQSVCNEVLLNVCEFVGGLTLFGYGGAESRHVSGRKKRQNRLFRSTSPSDRHPYSPILVHYPLTIAQSVCNEVLLDVCEFAGGLILFGYGGAESRHVSGRKKRQNRLFRSTSPSDRHPYSPILVNHRIRLCSRFQ